MRKSMTWLLSMVAAMLCCGQAQAADRKLASSPAADCRALADSRPDDVGNWITPHTAPGAYFIDGTALSSPDDLRTALEQASGRLTVLQGGSFAGGDLVDLGGSLAGACVIGTDLSQADLSGLILTGTGFIEADLTGANLAGAYLERVLLRTAKLEQADMSGAYLAEGRLDGGWDGTVEGWHAFGAFMRGFVFDCGITIWDGCAPDRNGIDFSGTYLEGADLASSGTGGAADFTRALLKGTAISPWQVLDFVEAGLDGSVLLTGGQQQVALAPDEFKELEQALKEGQGKADAPSFDCARARSSTERQICGPYESALRDLDRQMGQLYTIARARHADILRSQRAWLVERNNCESTECLREAYHERVLMLTAVAGPPPYPEAGETVSYYAATPPFPDPFRLSPLYARILPALKGAARQRVTLTRHADGSFAAEGEAVGANAHLCHLEAEWLQFDEESGWLSTFPPGKPPVPLLRLLGDRLFVYASGRPKWPEEEAIGEYVSCGMRAAFTPLQRLDPPAAN